MGFAARWLSEATAVVGSIASGQARGGGTAPSGDRSLDPGGGVDEALRQGTPARDLPWAAARSAPLPATRARPAVPWLGALLTAVISFAFVAFVGGGLYFGAITIYALSLYQAETGAVVPAGVREAFAMVTGGVAASSAEEGLPSPRRPFFAPIPLPDWEGTEPFNILLLGIDQRDDEREAGLPARSDTMILVRIDPKAKSAAMMSIPRDLWVDIPGFGQGRINTAYTYGELRKVEGGGPGLAKRTIEANFGLRVDYWARVDFHGFEQIVDTLGGIIVDVERPIKDDEYPTENYGIERVYVPAGLQFMDGRLALRYARSRHSENDFGRMRRQQRVLFAIRQRALQLNMLWRAPALVGQVRDMVATDLNIGQLIRLAKLAQQIDSDRVNSLLIDANYVREVRLPDGAQVLMPDKEKIRRGITSLVAGMNPEQAARIEVLNGSGRPGLAADTAKYLLNLGYDVVRIDDADRSDYVESVIEVFSGRRSLADDLAATLRLPRWTPREARGTDSDIDIRIIVGREFRLPTLSPTATVGAAPEAESLGR
jgi:LCP family protein required for cell wall assembly